MTGDTAIETGASGPDWDVPEVTRTNLVRYAGASGDMNPMHHDDTLAQSVGFPSVFAHGMFTAGVLSTYLERWLGTGSLRSYKVRFKTRVWPGDKLTCAAHVTGVRDVDGERVVDIEAQVTRQDDSVAVQAWASAVASGGIAG